MESVYVQRIMMNTENWLIKGVRIIRVWTVQFEQLNLTKIRDFQLN